MDADLDARFDAAMDEGERILCRMEALDAELDGLPYDSPQRAENHRRHVLLFEAHQEQMGICADITRERLQRHA